MADQSEPSPSRLLGLPGEIRNEIWELVLGRHTIHVDRQSEIIGGRRKWGELELSVCLSHYTETQAYQMSISKNPDKGYFEIDSKHSERWAAATNEALEKRHEPCRKSMEPSPSLSLLRACKQIYAEAKHIHLSSNTWAFQNPWTFKYFSNALTLPQRSIVRALALNVDWVDDYDHLRRFLDYEEDYDDEDEEEYAEDYSDYADVPDEDFRPTIGEWNQVLKPALTDTFNGLKTLHVHFLEVFHRSFSFVKAMIDKGWAAEGVLYFSRLPLEAVTVIVTCAKADVDPEIDEEAENFLDALPRGGRQHHAQLIKDLLLRNVDKMDRVDYLLNFLAEDPYYLPTNWGKCSSMVHQSTLERWRAESETEVDD